MLVEVPIATTTPRALDGTIPQLSYPDLADIPRVPQKYWKSTLTERRKNGGLPEVEWFQRALEVENYIKRVIMSQEYAVADVEFDDSDRDSDGPDGRLILASGFPTPNFPIHDIRIEMKSSPETLEAFKQKLRDEYFEEEIRRTMIGPWHPDAMTLEMNKKRQEWDRKTNAEHESIISGILTRQRIILINGGVGRSGAEKTPEKILYNSFYPQFFSIIEADKHGIPDEIFYGSFYPKVTESKRRVEERRQLLPYRFH